MGLTQVLESFQDSMRHFEELRQLGAPPLNKNRKLTAVLQRKSGQNILNFNGRCQAQSLGECLAGRVLADILFHTFSGLITQVPPPAGENVALRKHSIIVTCFGQS